MTRLLASTALASLGALIAAPALAQDAAANSDNSGIGEIVVTAQKRAENIQDVPIAISAVGSKFLESRGITSIDGLGSVSPNVKIERAPSNKTAAQISIRGSVTINPAITWEPAVGLYLDGVYVAKVQGSIFDIADLERVEVLRGPQGTLYGRNALAGAINLVTKKPSGELHASGEVSYGNYDFWRAKAVLDLPAIGPLSVKLSGQLTKRDGFVKITPNPYPAAFLALPNSVTSTNDVDGQSFMAQVRLKPEGPLTIDYTFDYSRNRQKPDFAQLYSVLGNNPASFNDLWTDPAILAAIAPLGLYASKTRQTTGSVNASPLYEYSRSMGHALTIGLDLGNVTLKSITAYRKLKWEDSLDLDGSPLDVAFTQRLSDFRAWSQELQATGSAMDDKLKYVLGGFYYNEKAETLGPQFFFGFLNQVAAPGAAVLQSDYGGHTKAYAAYAQIDYQLADPLTLTLGGRYTHEKKDIRRFFGVGKPVIPLFNLPYGGAPDATFNKFTPAVTLAYEASPDVNLYARWARGYKSGGFNGETDVSGLIGSPFSCSTAPGKASELCNPYRPELVDSYEVGIKARLADGKVILNLAGFWDEHKDIQLSVFTAKGAAASEVRNAAKARIQGLELETVLKPIPALTINGSIAVLDAKYKSYLDGGVDVSNNRAFPHTPKFTANLGVNWDVVTGDWGKFSLIGDLNHVGKYYTFPYALVGDPYTTQVAATTQSKGRTIINLRAALADVSVGGAKFDIAAWVKNVTKESNAQNFIDFGPGFGGLTLAYFPDPRTYGLTIGFKY
ncbi:TonB-dependent receptor [Novosphingobium sp. B 225]|uniref:TonB-dependent receptor n=1 Tax=Novosphingobium sp. B 225 TaxID=1961849 RepID=UPI000B4A9A6A|nr:TonB-dependent receptor [Novosphingobium sp. B 225]